MQCVILAGGKGTRMRPFTETMPKALLPVAGRPFVDHQLSRLASEGVRDLVLSIGYRGDLIRDFVGNGGRWGLSVRYADEGDDLRGTGGALRLALDEGLLDNAFAVLYGDSYLPIPLPPVWAAFAWSAAPALMVVLRNEGRWDASNARFEHGRVVLYDKGGHGDPSLDWIDYGLSVLTRPVIAERVSPAAAVDLADVLHDLSVEGLLAGLSVRERFYEAGSPEGLRDLERYLAEPSGSA